MEENQSGKSAGRRNQTIMIAIIIVGLLPVGAGIIYLEENKKLDKAADVISDVGNTTEKEVSTVFAPVTKEKENSKSATINKNYTYILSNNPEGVYLMRTDQAATNYDKFKGWYEDAQYLNSYDFKQMGSDNYKF